MRASIAASGASSVMLVLLHQRADLGERLRARGRQRTRTRSMSATAFLSSRIAAASAACSIRRSMISSRVRPPSGVGRDNPSDPSARCAPRLRSRCRARRDSARRERAHRWRDAPGARGNRTAARNGASAARATAAGMSSASISPENSVRSPILSEKDLSPAARTPSTASSSTSISARLRSADAQTLDAGLQELARAVGLARLKAERGPVIGVARRKLAVRLQMHPADGNGEIGAQAQLDTFGIGEHEGAAADLLARAVEEDFGRLKDRRLDARVALGGEDLKDLRRLRVEQREPRCVVIRKAPHDRSAAPLAKHRTQSIRRADRA